ncbi:MAG: substrate-binding domain-containing protein, partial [Eubacterium sp.]
TSTQDSGLLDVILPEFEGETGIAVKVVAVGTGKAIEMGKNGEADALLVHAKKQEEAFVKEGYGIERFDVMYNDFIVLGSKDDPAKLKEMAPNDAVKAFKTIADAQSPFISRGDKSGTNTKELALWKKAGVDPAGQAWYIESGSGMGDTLKMANEKLAYTLTDRATWLNMKNNLDLQVVVEKGDDLYNQYGVIVVNPEKVTAKLNTDNAKKFQEWILSEKTQKLIGDYKINGEPTFVPNASK